MEGRRHAIRHGDLVGARGIVTIDEREHRATEWATSVLGSQLIRVDRPGNGVGHILDHLNGAEMRRLRDECLRLRAVTREGRRIGRRAEAGILRRWIVHRNRRAEDRRRDRHGNQREDQKLLTPFAPKEAPRPMRHGASRGNASVGRPSLGPKPEVVHGYAGFGASGLSSSSGLGGGNVSSTALPSRKNTTRSAHEASLASWVTTTAATPP